MRISDWSSDVCSSDLGAVDRCVTTPQPHDDGSSSSGSATRFARWSIPSDRRRSPSPGHATPRTVWGSSRWRPITRRSEEHTSELQSLMSSSYPVFWLKKKRIDHDKTRSTEQTSEFEPLMDK